MELECEWIPFQFRPGTGKAEPLYEKSVFSQLHSRGTELELFNIRSKDWQWESLLLHWPAPYPWQAAYLAGPQSPSHLVGETNPILWWETKTFRTRKILSPFFPFNEYKLLQFKW